MTIALTPSNPSSSIEDRDVTLASPAFRYTWLLWATAFLLPWMLLFVARPALRRPML